ncbi:MAG: hypothetical protein ABIN11_05260 [candidate division WOR-3 bacterium]
MYKRNLIVIILVHCLKLFPIDTEFNLERYFVDTILPKPVDMLYPVYNYNEISFCFPKLIYFFSKHYENSFSYSLSSFTDFKDSLKFDFKYNGNIFFRNQNISFENNTQINNKNIILSKFLYRTNFQYNDFYVLITPQFYAYPTVFFFKNLSSVELIYKRKIFLKSNYQNFTDLKTGYLGAGILSRYGNLGIFYSTLILPSYCFDKKIKNLHIKFNLDANMNEKDTLGILSKKRKDIHSIVPQRKYFFDLGLNFQNIALNFLAVKILEQLKSYEEFKKSPIFYDFVFSVKNEGRNFRYNFKIGNYYDNFTSKNFFISLFYLNKFGKVYLTNELKYYIYKSIIYDISISFNEENSYLTFGIKNLFSTYDLIYSYFTDRTYFFLLSFSNIQFFD